MKTKNVMPKNLQVGDNVQFSEEIGTVVSNVPASVPPHDKYDIHSRSVEFSFPGKSNLVVRLKGNDAMKVVVDSPND